jgi:hypothetical protein
VGHIKLVQLQSRMGLLLAAVVVALICGMQVVAASNDEKIMRQKIQAATELRKILILSYGMWQETGVLNANAVWRRLGRKDAYPDPWGNPYHIESNPKTLRCFSAGPDAIINTADDFEQWLPRDIPGAQQNAIERENSAESQESAKISGSSAQ